MQQVHNYGILIDPRVRFLISPILYKLHIVLFVSTEGQPEGSSKKEICMKYKKNVGMPIYLENENTRGEYSSKHFEIFHIPYFHNFENLPQCLVPSNPQHRKHIGHF